MRKLIALFLLTASVAYAQFPMRYNSVTSDVAKVTGNFDTFAWKWAGADSQTNSIYVKNGSAWVDLDGDSVYYKISRNTSTGVVTYISSSNVSVVDSNVAFVVSNTNIPPNGSYLFEMYAVNGSISRTLAQGKITVFQSLYQEGDGMYPWPIIDGVSVTKLIAGSGISLSPTNGLGAVTITSTASGGGTNHAELTNLAWTDSGHTGTAGRLAGFFEGGAAGYGGFGAGVYLDGDDNIAISNAVLAGAAAGALYVGDVVAANVNAFLATNTAHGFKAAGSDGFQIISSGNSTCVTFGAGGGCSAQFGDGANFQGQVQVASLNVTNGNLTVSDNVIGNDGSIALINSAQDSGIGIADGVVAIGSTNGLTLSQASGAVLITLPADNTPAEVNTDAVGGDDIVNYDTMTNYVAQNAPAPSGGGSITNEVIYIDASSAGNMTFASQHNLLTTNDAVYGTTRKAGWFDQTTRQQTPAVKFQWPKNSNSNVTVSAQSWPYQGATTGATPTQTWFVWIDGTAYSNTQTGVGSTMADQANWTYSFTHTGAVQGGWSMISVGMAATNDGGTTRTGATVWEAIKCEFGAQ